ncbi:MAG: hypothetical protein CENE_01649 [Candidatus Celerinatantimonas neptuna]|nr:MAG: hypothetical protein CENE_01649 [Candidatus Celerinatantimonas neptuna]
MMLSKPLSANALHWLNKLDKSLNSKGVESKKTHLKTVRQVLNWCLEQSLVADNVLELPQFTFTKALLDQIDQAQRQLRHTRFRDDATGKTRTDAMAGDPQTEYKSRGDTPREHRVLIRLSEPVEILGQPTRFIDKDWRELPLERFTTLLAVENLDVFYQLEAYQWPFEDPGTLVFYRGDAMYGKGGSAFEKAWNQTGKPAMYFGDFDPAGVRIAINGGYQSMILPDLVTLKQAASEQMFPDSHQKYLPELQSFQTENKSTNCDFNLYLNILFKYRALQQQKMQGVGLQRVTLR